MKQQETVAYGHPEFGGIVFGGEKPSDGFSLEQWDFTDDDDAYKVTVDFYIYGASKADFVAKLGALSAAVRNSGNLAITTGANTSRTIDLTVAGQLLTITLTAGASFTALDLGLPIDLVGVGTFQITEVVGGAAVKCLIPAGITAPAPAVGLTATIGYTHFLAVDNPDKTGFLASANIDRAPDGDDDDLRRRFRFTATIGKPASATRAAAFGNRRKGFYRVSTGGTGLKTLSFRGVYTAGDGANAIAAYSAAATGFAAWVATVSAAFVGTTGPFEIVGQDSYEVDDEVGLLTFTGGRSQVNFPETAVDVDSGLISGTQVGFTRSIDMVHGLPNIHKPYVVSISYSTNVDAEQTPYTGILDLWTGTIKPHLLKQAENMFGSVLVILSETSPAIDAANNKLAASLSLLVSRSGSTIYQYRKTVTYDFDERIVDDTLHDGIPNTYATWSPGSATIGSVVVAVTQLGQPQGGQGASGGGLISNFGIGGISPGLTGGGFFGIGKGPLQISFDGGEGAAKDDKPSKPSKFPEPGDPNLVLDNLPGVGAWKSRRKQVRITPEFWGEDPEGLGASIDVSFSIYSQSFRWVNTGGSTTDPTRIPTKEVRRKGGGGENSKFDPKPIGQDGNQ